MMGDELNELLETTNADALLAGLLQHSGLAGDGVAGGWAAIEACLGFLDTVDQTDAVKSARNLLLSTAHLHTRDVQSTAASHDRQAAAFKRVLQRWSRVLPVIGDGNCLFRAVIRHIFAPLRVPRDREDALSLRLRTAANAAADSTSELAGFVVAGENDAATMARAGEWADAVQVAKLQAYLRTPLHVVRWDDPAFTISSTGKLLPGPENRFGEGEDAIVLLFTPSPGHYETLVSKALVEPELEMELCALESGNGSPINACNAVLLLEAATDELCELWMVCNATGEADVRRVISEDLTLRGKAHIAAIARLKNVVSLMHHSSSTATSNLDGRTALMLGMMNELVADEIAFVQGEEAPLITGTGPISSLYLRTISASKGMATVAANSSRQRSNSWSHRQPAVAPPQSQPLSRTESHALAGDAYPEITAATAPMPFGRAEQGAKEELISSDTATEERWESQLRNDGNTIQIRMAKVHGTSLAQLISVIKKGRVKLRFIEFFFSEFDDFAAVLLFNTDLHPLNMITLDGCTLPSSFATCKPSKILFLKKPKYL